jgi:hypothetical protein
MSFRRALLCFAIAVRVMLTCDVGQVEEEQLEACFTYLGHAPLFWNRSITAPS